MSLRLEPLRDDYKERYARALESISADVRPAAAEPVLDSIELALRRRDAQQREYRRRRSI